VRIDIANSVFQPGPFQRVILDVGRDERRDTQVLIARVAGVRGENPIAVSPRLCDGVAHVTHLSGRIAAPVV